MDEEKNGRGEKFRSGTPVHSVVSRLAHALLVFVLLTLLVRAVWYGVALVIDDARGPKTPPVRNYGPSTQDIVRATPDCFALFLPRFSSYLPADFHISHMSVSIIFFPSFLFFLVFFFRRAASLNLEDRSDNRTDNKRI